MTPTVMHEIAEEMNVRAVAFHGGAVEKDDGMTMRGGRVLVALHDNVTYPVRLWMLCEGERGVELRLSRSEALCLAEALAGAAEGKVTATLLRVP